MAAPAQQLNDLSLDHYGQREVFVNASAEVAGQMWSEVNPNDIVNSWAAQVPELTAIVSGAQLGAVRPADSYVSAALGAQDVVDEAVSPINPSGFAGVSAEGGPLLSLFTHPAFVTLASISDGIDISRAMGMGRSNLDMLVRTEVADAGRLADQVALTAHRAATGYTRLAVGNSCARCLVLAGKEYEWNAGFLRHPRCDCVHVPSGRRKARKAKSPQQIYDRMTASQRTRAGFTKADQRAIAEGADLNQVVNAQRGMYVPGSGVRRVRRPDGTTLEGTTRRSIAGKRLKGSPRLTVDEVYRIAGDQRDEALELLYRNGYLLEKPRLLPTPAERVAQIQAAQTARLAELGIPPVPGPRHRALPAPLDFSAARQGEAALASTHSVQSAIQKAQLTRGLPEPIRPRDAIRLKNAVYDRETGYAGGGYRGVNRALQEARGDVPDAIRAQVDDLDRVIRLGSVTDDAVLYRGVARPELLTGGRPLRVGDEFTEHGYSSTSVSLEHADDFARGRSTPIDELGARPANPTVIRFIAPRGQKAIQISDLEWPGVGEVLLPRGMSYRVVADRGIIDGVRQLDAQLITGRLAIPGGFPGAGAAPVIQVRASLLRPKTVKGLEQAWTAEMQRVTGRRISVSVPADASLFTAREYAEGVVRGLERFPDARLARIMFEDLPPAANGVVPYAEAGGQSIAFDIKWARETEQQRALRSMRGDISQWDQPGVTGGWSNRGDGNPTSVAIHEFGHILDIDNLGSRIHGEALLRMDALAARAGIDTDTLVAREISAYAGSDAHEMIAEAFADVMLRGDAASIASRRIVEVLEREYAAGGFRAVGGAVARFPARASSGLNVMTVPQLRTLARERGVAIPAGAKKADIVRLLDEGSAPRGLTPAQFEAAARRSVSGEAALDVPPFRMTQGAVARGDRTEQLALIRDEAQLRETVAALDYYRKNSSRVNVDLRSGAELSPESAARIAAIDRAMAVSELPRPVEVWRGLTAGKRSDQIFGPRASWPDDLAGVEWTDSGFVGTAIRRSTARSETATFEGSGVLMRIVAPKGTHGVQLSGGVYEGEILLARGTKFRVVKDHGVPDELIAGKPAKFRVLDVEIVPVTAPTKAVAPKAPPAKSARDLKPGDTFLLPEQGVMRVEYVSRSGGGDVVVGYSDPGRPGTVANRGAIRVPGGEKFVVRIEPGAVGLRTPPSKVVAPKAPPGTAATARQKLIDKRRQTADFNADTLEALSAEVDTDVLVRTIAQSAARNAIPKRTVDSLVTAARSGDPAKVEAALARISRTAKVKPLARPTEVVGFDPKTMQALESARPGQKVRVIRPGHTADVNGETVQLSRSVVEVLTPAEIRDIEGRALRQAARERNRLIEARTGTAKLLAEVDELISKGASKATILQRLDVKLIEPEQIYAGADAAVVKALRTAVESGDTAALRRALTSAGTKAKIKPVSRAGAKVKFDPDLMEPVGADIAKGAQVVVVTRGSTLTLPDGKVLQLTKAKVTTVAKPVKAAKATARKAAEGAAAFRAAPAGLGRTVTGLTDAQAEIVEKYKGVFGYRRINQALRSGEMSPAAAAEIRLLDEAMASSRLTADVAVHRGVRDGHDIFGDRFAGDLAGAEFGDLAYVSTARSVGQAENIARHGFGSAADPLDPLVMRIIAPRGTSAIEVSDTELLLDRGLSFRVVADRGVRDGIRRIDVEVIPSARRKVAP